MSDQRLSLIELLKAQWRVTYALMLRDIRTRFFAHGLGFLLAIAWPLTHIMAIVLIFSLTGRSQPYGDNAALFIATGVIPFMCFSYMSRFIMLGIVMNKNLLTFPVVKITDVLFARALLEVLSAGLVILTVAIIFASMGIDFTPVDITQACCAIGASMLLGLGVGVVNALIATAVPFWITGYALMSIPLWMGSGVLFVADSLPEQYRRLLAYNPTIHCVEWMRSAYYEGYGAEILDKQYVITWGLVSLFLGLVIERVVRGRLLQG